MTAARGLGWAGARWVRLVVGVLLVGLGALLVFKPFASLAVLVVVLVGALVVAGVGELLRRHAGVWGWVPGTAYLGAAVVVLVWPGATIRVVAVAVAGALLVGGVAELVAGRRVRGTARVNAVVGGAASVLFGLLALAWPDVTVLVVAVVFGARVLIVGVRQVVAFVKGDDVPLVRRPSAATRPKGGRLTGTVLGAVVALDKPIWSGNPGAGAFGQLLRDNVPSGPVKAPVLIGQGAADTLILPATQAEYVDARCAAGYPVDYRTYEGRDHVPLVEPDSPAVRDILTWTTDRFDNKPAKNTC
ncbi:alpha/beta hydrolase family protein [Kribbella sp. NPDC054772]